MILLFGALWLLICSAIAEFLLTYLLTYYLFNSFNSTPCATKKTARQFSLTEKLWQNDVDHFDNNSLIVAFRNDLLRMLQLNTSSWICLTAASPSMISLLTLPSTEWGADYWVHISAAISGARSTKTVSLLYVRFPSCPSPSFSPILAPPNSIFPIFWSVSLVWGYTLYIPFMQEKLRVWTINHCR